MGVQNITSKKPITAWLDAQLGAHKDAEGEIEYDKLRAALDEQAETQGVKFTGSLNVDEVFAEWRKNIEMWESHYAAQDVEDDDEEMLEMAPAPRPEIRIRPLKLPEGNLLCDGCGEDMPDDGYAVHVDNVVSTTDATMKSKSYFACSSSCADELAQAATVFRALEKPSEAASGE